MCLTRGQLVHDEKRKNGIGLSGRINAFMMLVKDPLQNTPHAHIPVMDNRHAIQLILCTFHGEALARKTCQGSVREDSAFSQCICTADA